MKRLLSLAVAVLVCGASAFAADLSIGGLTLIEAASIDLVNDRVIVWDNSATGSARTKAMTVTQFVALIRGQIDIADINDVTLASVADNELLAYDSTSGEWINQTAAEAGLATSAHNHDGTYQPADADLTTFAGITPSADVQSLLGAADYAAMRTQLSLVVGTHVLAPNGDGSGLSGVVKTEDISAEVFQFVVDEDDMVSDSDVLIPTQQSVKAYVDTQIATTGASGSITGALTMSGDITPTEIAADVNDYNPTGLSSASVLRLSSDAARTITGIMGGSDGRILKLLNVGSHPITLAEEDTDSAASNRFTGGSYVLAAGGGAEIIYDSTSARWRFGRGLPIDNTTLGSDSTGKLKVADGGVGATQLAATLDLTGKTVTVATASAGDSDTSPASTEFVQTELDAKALVCFALTIDDVADGMDYGIGYVPAAFTVSRLVVVHSGSGLSSPDIDVMIRHGTDRSDTGNALVSAGTTCTSSTTGTVVTSFDDATVAANSFLWLETSSKSGTTDNLEVFVFGTYD